MSFRSLGNTSHVPDSPEKILFDYPKRKIQGPLVHQGEIMKAYANEALTKPDVALQLPTGSGKTLVGLSIGEWLRRKMDYKVVYLCPTNQLVNQVVEQANIQYGLSVNGFTGSIKDYDAVAKSSYNQAEKIAITSYNGLFNTNPFFSDPDIVIVDDAHVAENYIPAMWSVNINRLDANHEVLHTALCSVLKKVISPVSFTRLTGEYDSLAGMTWVDKLSTPVFNSIHNEFLDILDTYAPSLSISYNWELIRDHLHACHLYLSVNEILIRPLIPPTWTHNPFNNATQRIYMSATLGNGGDLERMTGRHSITRLPVPQGWDQRGIGRRYFMFPTMSLDEDTTTELKYSLMKKAGRSLVLVPSHRLSNIEVDQINENLGFETFTAYDLEDSKSDFIQKSKAVAVVANRYDGIDFPGDDCRLLFIQGLPRGANTQEKFLMSRMGANILFNERIQTRVLQAIGRCTRSLTDFSAVVVTGEDLPEYLTDTRKRRMLHPELQAELKFGIEQSRNTNVEHFINTLSIFLENGDDWAKANSEIIAEREKLHQEAINGTDELQKVVQDEIAFQSALWQGDFVLAFTKAEKVLANLIGEDLRGYRALWHYLAGSAAFLGFTNGIKSLQIKSTQQYEQAKKSATGIPWLVDLAHSNTDNRTETKKDISEIEQIENIERLLARLGTIHSRKFDELEKEILTGLNDNSTFEEAQKKLGEVLGFVSGNDESDASPDPWWILGSKCIVFEDHAGANDTSTLGATKARQAADHPRWIKDNVAGAKDCEILPVLLSPISKAKSGAMPHLKTVGFWKLSEFKTWASEALSVIRELRTTFKEIGDIGWRSEAISKLEANGLNFGSIYDQLSSNLAADVLEEVQ